MKKKFEGKFLKTIRKFSVPVAFCLIFAMVWNSIPVTAEVSDNLQDAVAHILGQRNDSVSGDDYTNASTNAKLNKLNDTITSLQSELTTVKTKVNDLSLSTSSLSSLDFATIQKMCKAGTISKVVHPGDNLYDSERHRYIVLGINEDVPCDQYGNNTSGHTQVLTLLFADGYGEAPMYNPDRYIDRSTDSVEWSNSDMRLTTMSKFVDMLPRDVTGVIGYVKTDNATADKAFLLSHDEVFSGGYSYFKNSVTRNLNNGTWWLRNPNFNGSRSFYCVDHGSDSYEDGWKWSYGVFPAICIY